jgi:undecaprenyl-diphosphatase
MKVILGVCKRGEVMYFNIFKKINIFDDFVLHIISKKMKNKYFDKFMPIITSLGNLGIIWVAIAIILLFDKQDKTIGGVVILTLIIGSLIGEGMIKHIVRRIRPCNKQNNIALLISKPISYSFPSGHTLSSFAAAEVLSMYFTNYKMIFITIAFLIALSRIYLYVHYPTDVIAGILIGIFCSKFIFIILQEAYIINLCNFFKNML